MLYKRRCPHTGVLNFYSDEDPHLAVGSVVAASVANSEGRFFWHFYTDPFARAGLAGDSKSAEREVMAAGLLAERAKADRRCVAA